VADFPDYVLDERQRGERERGYFDAFRIAGAFAVLLASVALFVVARRDRNGNGSLTLDYGAVSAIFRGTFAVVLRPTQRRPRPPPINPRSPRIVRCRYATE
jgi:hypothetical protein